MSPFDSGAPLPPCVLLTSGNAWGSLLGMVRSLGARGVPLHAVGLGTRLDLLSRSRFPCRTHTIPFDGDAATAAARLVAWARTIGARARPVLIPMNDPACTCVAEAREVLDAAFAICAPSPATSLTFLDKRRAHAAAEAAGLTVPRSAFAAGADEVRRLADTMPYPVIFKPTWWREEGGHAFKTVRCDDRARFLEAALPLVAGGASLAVQEFVPGGDEAVEVYMFYRSREGRTIWDCTGRKIRQVPAGAGIMALGRTEPIPDVEAASRRFLERIDYRGLGGIEFKRARGSLYFIELSVRPEGFHPLAIRAGVDLPWCAYSDVAFGRTLPTAPAPAPANWLDELCVIGLLRRGGDRRLVLRDVLAMLARDGPVCAVLSADDPIPGFAWAGELLRHLFPGRSRPAS